MLRKTIHIIITALLLTATTGFTVSRHYCGDTLVSYSLSAEAAACCEDISGECCHDDSEHFQIEQEFLASSLSLENNFFLTFELIQSVIDFQIPESSSGLTTITKKSFPLKTHLLLVRLQKFLL
ncbi:MAG: HYC_CC_PP family protein [Bacteroidota bacterium]